MQDMGAQAEPSVLCTIPDARTLKGLVAVVATCRDPGSCQIATLGTFI